jgi:DNA-binding NtrC family response regulator
MDIRDPESEGSNRMAAQDRWLLIVHPTVDVLSHAVGALEVLGHRLAVTPRAAEALILAHRRAPDVLVCSMELKDMGSLEFIEQFKKICPETPIIALAEAPSVGMFREVVSAGGQDLLPSRCEEQALLWSVCRSMEKEEEFAGHWAS